MAMSLIREHASLCSAGGLCIVLKGIKIRSLTQTEVILLHA